MLRVTQISLFLLTLGMPASTMFAQDEAPTLQRHFNKSGRFEALMPGNAKSVTVPGKEIMDTYYEARGKAGGADFKLRVQVISPIDLGEDMNAKFTDMYVTQAREQQKAAFGTAKTDKAIKQHGMQGADFAYSIPASASATGQDSIYRQRVMFDGKRLYIATVSGPADAVNSKSGTQFLDSVKPLQEQTVQVYSNTEGRFEAVMHGKPEHNVTKVGDGPDDVQHQYFVSASDGVYMVAYQDHPGLDSNDPTVAEEVFASARDGFQKGIGGEQTEYKTITQANLNGRETRFRVPSNQGASTTRMFFVNHRWYHVFVLGTAEFVSSQPAQQFLDSFKVTRDDSAKKSSREDLIQKLKDF